ncbi:MAG: TolC family protein, partial [Verrucomicrobiia bacterium]
EAEQQKLAVGQSTFYVVLQLQGDLAAARSQEARAKADYNKSLSMLHRAEASLLERHKIDIEYK